MFFDDWERLSEPNIRPATPSDARAIARIHVDAWRSTYQGIVPEDVLEGLQYSDRERTWMRLIAGGDSGPYVLVADHPNDGIVGFIAAGPERSDIPDYAGEVYAIYVDKPHQRSGVGRSLLQYVAQIMIENAQQGLVLWTFSVSPPNDFFRQLGGEEVLTRTREFGDAEVEETAFGWPDTRRLLEEGAPEDEDHDEPEDTEPEAGPETHD